MVSAMYSAMSALKGISTKVHATAHNTANVNTDGYKKTKVTLSEADIQGVEVNIQKIETPGPMIYEETEEGYNLVEQSNVELTEEIPNLIMSRRFFQANLVTIRTNDEMLGSLLDIKG